MPHVQGAKKLLYAFLTSKFQFIMFLLTCPQLSPPLHAAHAFLGEATSALAAGDRLGPQFPTCSGAKCLIPENKVSISLLHIALPNKIKLVYYLGLDNSI